MLFVSIINIFIVFFAYLSDKSKNISWLKLSFIIIFLFSALRYGYGNDYFGYLEGFRNIRYTDSDAHFELGWQYLNLLFQPFGFFAMTATLAAFNSYIYYRFLKKYVPSQYYWLALFLYVFNPYIMLLHLSAMRQALAISLFIYSIDYIYKKDLMRYALCIVLASMFHKSAIIYLPMYFVFAKNWRLKQVKGFIVFILFSLILILANKLTPYFNYVVINYFEEYNIYFGSSKLNSGFGLLMNVMIFVIILMYAVSENKSERQKENNYILYNIAIANYFLYPLAFIVYLASRIGMYTAPAIIAIIPIILNNNGAKDIRKLFLLLIVLATTLFSYYVFFNYTVYSQPYSEYKTIFSAPRIY